MESAFKPLSAGGFGSEDSFLFLDLVEGLGNIDGLAGPRVNPGMVHGGRQSHRGRSENLDALDRPVSVLLQASDFPEKLPGLLRSAAGVGDHVIVFQALPPGGVGLTESPPEPLEGFSPSLFINRRTFFETCSGAIFNSPDT